MATDGRKSSARKGGAGRLALLLGTLLLLAGCKTELYSHLSEGEANRMLAILLDAGISADRATDAKERTLTISVDKSRFAAAVEILAAHGYPKQKFASPADIFPGDGLVVSPVAERARLLYATSQELSHTVSEIDGVLSARVQVALPESDNLRATAAPPSASVFIRYVQSAPIDPLVPQIKTLVADSVPGLSYDHVSVVLVPAAANGFSPAASATGDAQAANWAGSGAFDMSSGILRWLAILAALAALGGLAGWAYSHRPRPSRPEQDAA
ncbi:hypothetical protein GCM10011611_08590 [Aliidongia dinghuensis]|uniref:Lipoprotein n=1 Tax=Aliidongia dinghuensis TaxID=1867774 RepID=A0A8J2YQU9_9PROT|nr:type III secretion inner membrane ring lipoprotein SctJ [Aliidongia dinghuensis]GGF05382.1 hypothetical protein GCM10011611_08590 [Aliidongia dinghuensis]